MYFGWSLCEENDELKQWLLSFKDQLDDESFALVYGTLRANQFSSRLKIKLIGDEQIGLMFPKEVSLGTKALLKYQIEVLRNESPLVSKAKTANYKRQDDTEVAETTSKQKPAKKVCTEFLKTILAPKARQSFIVLV
jgi:hypothetical protein